MTCFDLSVQVSLMPMLEADLDSQEVTTSGNDEEADQLKQCDSTVFHDYLDYFSCLQVSFRFNTGVGPPDVKLLPGSD